MKIAKRMTNRKWVTVIALDAPGIGGAGGKVSQRFVDHIAIGGEFLHHTRTRFYK